MRLIMKQGMSSIVDIGCKVQTLKFKFINRRSNLFDYQTYIKITPRFFVLFLVFNLVILEIYAGVSLFADGSFFLINILSTKNFFIFYKARIFSQLIPQIPVVYALKFGVNDLNFLIKIYGLGLIAIPVGLWISALIIQIRTDLFWMFVMAFSISYLSSGFFAVGEYNFSYGLTALITSLLLHDNIGKMKQMILLFSSFFIIVTYETMIFLGPLLFTICVLRFLTTERNTFFSKILIVIALFFFLSTVISISSLLIPGPGHPSGAAGDAFKMTISTHFIFFLFMGFLFVISLNKNSKTPYFLLALLIAVAHIVNTNFWCLPEMNYSFRFLSGLGICFLFALSALYYFANRRSFLKFSKGVSTIYHSPLFYLLKLTRSLLKIKRTLSNPIPMLIFISSIIPYYIQTIDFYNWGNKYEHEINVQKGMISIKKTILADSIYNWFWTSSFLSMILRENQAGALFLNGDNNEALQPIDPYGTGNFFNQTDSSALKYLNKKSPYYHDWPLLDNLDRFLAFNASMHGLRRPNGSLPGSGL